MLPIQKLKTTKLTVLLLNMSISSVKVQLLVSKRRPRQRPIVHRHRGRPRPSPFKGTLQGFGRVTLEGLPFRLHLVGCFEGVSNGRACEGREEEGKGHEGEALLASEG